MKGSVAALDRWKGRKAAARLVDGELDDFLIDPPEAGPPVPESIYLVDPGRPMKHQGGSFVDLPCGQRGFLRHAGGEPKGPLLAQVVSYAEPGKAVPMTAKLSLKGRLAILTPDAPGLNLSREIRRAEDRAALQEIAEAAVRRLVYPGGLILRTDALNVPADALGQELGALVGDVNNLRSASGTAPCLARRGPDSHARAGRDWPDPDLWDHKPGSFARHGIDERIAALASPRHALPNGGAAWIEATRACVTVDVNTGPDSSPAAGLKANIALARMLPRALRCRGLGGKVVIDAAPMAKKDRRQFENALKLALRGDPVETALVGWTTLGLFELQRHRARLPLAVH